jgi:hypothetical protein
MYMRETPAKENAMRRIVQPAGRPAWMWKRNERDAIRHTHLTHGVLEWHFPPETIYRETAEQKDHARSQKCELLVEPRSAERDLSGRRAAIAASGGRLAREALGDRCAIREVGLVDPGLSEPPSELRAGAAAEGLPGRQLRRTRRLADDRYAIANRTRDDGPRTLEIAAGDAFRARTDSRVEIREGRCVRALIRVRTRSGMTPYTFLRNVERHRAKDAA